MYHNTLIRRDHPQQAELEKVIELILAYTAADSIYFSPHLEEDLNEGIILVVIGEDSPQDFEELYLNSWKIFEAFPQFSFRIFDAGWIKEELQDGNPFFVMHCNRHQLIYSTTESAEISYTEKLKPKRFLKKAKSKHLISDESAFTVGVDLKFYMRSENYLQAAYTVHQNIRWLYIAASWFLTGEWLVEQNLEAQQKHLGRFSKSLGKAFDPNLEEEATVLSKLNDACNTVQNKHDAPELTAALIKAAEAKKEWLRQEVQRLFNECISRCQYQFSLKKIPLIEIDERDPLKLITKIITDTIETSAIYCFGQRHTNRTAVSTILDESTVDFQNTHHYLFIITKNYKADIPGNIASTIKTQTGGQHTVTLLMHSKKSLHQKRNDQQHFFYQIMQRGQLLFQETPTPPFLPFEEIPARNIKSTKMYLHQRDRTKEFLMEAEAMDGGSGATKIQIFMMHLVVEQTCLGLIRLFIGYMPNHFSLPFLFELCDYFTPLASEIFPRETEKDKELLKILSGHNTSLRYGFIDDVPYHDYEVLSNRYNEFVDRADKLAVKELERLEKLHEDPDPKKSLDNKE